MDDDDDNNDGDNDVCATSVFVDDDNCFIFDLGSSDPFTSQSDAKQTAPKTGRVGGQQRTRVPDTHIHTRKNVNYLETKCHACISEGGQQADAN